MLLKTTHSCRTRSCAHTSNVPLWQATVLKEIGDQQNAPQDDSQLQNTTVAYPKRLSDNGAI